MENYPVITIDGPSAAGKSTLSKLISKILNWNFLDSGIIYRALALVILNKYYSIIPSEIKLVNLISNLNIKMFLNETDLAVIVENEDVGRKIYTQEIANIASRIAALPIVRKALLGYQRSFLEKPGLIADGRDMGTVVFPKAQVKIYLEASLKKRTCRRMLELKKKGINTTFINLLSEIKNRDNLDINRSIAPLVPAEDALIIDSTDLTVVEVSERILRYIREKIPNV